MKSIALLLFVLWYTLSAVCQFSTLQQDRLLPAANRKQLMDSLIKQITDGYVFEDRAAQIGKGLQIFRRTKAFAGIDDIGAFAALLNPELQRLSNDKHLRLLYSYDSVPAPGKNEAPIPEFIRQFAIDNNYGFNKLEILSGNIGYMNILGFFPYEQTKDIAIGAFHFIENTSALIVDLRNNTGGESNICNFIISYFFGPEPVNLGNTRYRKDNRIEQSWSAWYVPGKRYVNKPLYILTSHLTFSAGEAMAFLLSAHVHAIVVGEQTGGGGNLCDLVRLGNHVVLNLPIASPYPSTTKTWEGTGVIPDMQVSADQALEMAHEAAVKKLAVKAE